MFPPLFVQVVPLLCNRTITAEMYVTALFDKIDPQVCLNAWAASFNKTTVCAFCWVLGVQCFG